MKKLLVEIITFVLCGIMLCGCGNKGSYPREDHSKESLQGAYIYFDNDGNPEYDYYYAYSASGELMFTLKEYAYESSGVNGLTSLYWYTADTLQTATYAYPQVSYVLTVDTLYNSAKREVRRDSLLMYDGNLQYLSVREFTYSGDGLSSADKVTNYSSSAQTNPVTSHSVYNKDGKLLESYAADSTGKEYLTEKIEYMADGNISIIKDYTYNSDGTTAVSVTGYTYDEKGNVLTYIVTDEATGEVTKSMSYAYSYNSDGTISEESIKNEATGKTGTYKYYYMNVSETEYSKKYVGYWKSTSDKGSYFLEMSVNGLICVGNFDSTFGIMTPQVYGFYEVQDDGIAVCELYDNACIQPETYLQGTVYIKNGKLIFNEIEFEKVD